MEPLKVEFKKPFSQFLPVPDGKGSWLSTSKLVVVTERVGVIEIPAGSHNNLASIPRVFRSLFPVNAPHRIAAIIHDYLYEKKGKLPGRQLTRLECDQVFYDAMRATKGAWWGGLDEHQQKMLFDNCLTEPFIERDDDPLVNLAKARTMYRAVRVGGWVPWNN